jgi:hypothetical protein
MIPRTDQKTASSIDLAVCLQRSIGPHLAACLLRRFGIPLDLALRVLAGPARRRRG